MNIFRFFGDMSHTASILVLLLKLRASKSAAGISLKTQELFLVVFLTRYLDLFFHFISLYNSIMKVLYISLTSLIIYMIREQLPIKATYDKSQDSFLHWKFAVAPCAVLALIVHAWDSGLQAGSFFSMLNFFWIFSEVLEPVAIVPQLVVLQRYREVENLTEQPLNDAEEEEACVDPDPDLEELLLGPPQPPPALEENPSRRAGHYVFLLGTYRLLYILNWVYRAHYEYGYVHHPLLYFAGLVQTLLYADFFYYYAISKYYGGRMALPA